MTKRSIDLIPVYHTYNGCRCSEVCFHLKHHIENGDIVEADNVVYLDGTHPKHGEVLVCGVCEKNIHTFIKKHGRYLTD
jgi:hypothetical protein